MAVGAAAALKAREDATGHARQIVAAARRAGLAAFAAFVAVWLVVTGTAVLFGSTGWVVILVIGLAVGLAAAPRWVARTWDPAGLGVAVAEPTVAAARPPVRPEALSTPGLCLAWRRSYLALLDPRPDPPATSSSGSADACSTSSNGATTPASLAGSRRVPVRAATRPAT